MDEENLDIVKKFNQKASKIEKQDLDFWVDELIKYYSDKINFLAGKAYGFEARSINHVSNASFREQIKEEIKNSIYTFLFKSEHWKTGRDINTYLLTCLNRFADKIYFDLNSVKKNNYPVCPGCKHFGLKNICYIEDKFLKCSHCSNEIQRLSDEIKLLKTNTNLSKQNIQDISFFESKLRIHKTFYLHSKKGLQCKYCYRFLPESSIGENGISCPFNDCDFFGDYKKLLFMNHPMGLFNRYNISLQSEKNKFLDGKKEELQNFLISENINADIQIEVTQKFDSEYNQLLNVIDNQVKSIKRLNSSETLIKKLLMYEAYKNIIIKYPEELISYLIYRKKNVEFPIQSKIFQEYAKLINEALPFTIKINKNKHTIYNLLDSKLQLFDGISEFTTEILPNKSILNNTIEHYISNNTFKDYGPCFIGYIIDIIDKRTNISIKNKIKNYTFSQINMENDIEINIPVLVKHFRIKSHYEIDSLVYLQRVRKKIVNSIYFKLNGKKIEKGNE